MGRRFGDAVIHHVEHGSGVPLVALHGAGVDHREVEAAIEAVVPATGYRRIYPDLPGMGRSTAGASACNDDVVALLGDLVEGLDRGPVALLGHSYGAHLARGVAAQRPRLVRGLALVCPVTEGSGELPEHGVVHEEPGAYEELGPGQRRGFEEYFVVRTRATARRYRDHVAPGAALVDQAALGRIVAGWSVDVGTPTSVPTLIVAGRCDAVVGHAGAVELSRRYPQATVAVVAGAGHALVHERPALFAALLADWLERTRGDGG